jgi:hypothetical protein
VEHNYSHRLETSLDEMQLALIRLVQDEATQQGVPLYIVGGAVRDLILGRPLNDFDLTVEGDAISLARALAKQGRAMLVDLALESPNLSVIASDVNAPGLSELVQGSASFGQIITRDRYSRVHLITVGRGDVSSNAILSSQRLAITLEALSRSYDYVVLDAGALPEIAPEKFARLAPRAVLVADDIDGPATESARERLLSAGFPNVSVLASAPDGPEFNAGGNRAAA